jgi:outer membrane lipoprotein SlyB
MRTSVLLLVAGLLSSGVVPIQAQDQLAPSSIPTEAAAAGAFVGAAPGVAAHNGKEAALGAAAGAVTAFMLSSGLGQELTLDKNTKLELTLDHPLNLN